MILALALSGCLAPECAHGEYFGSDCRVAAENHYARFIASNGLELRFHADVTETVEGWEPLGVFRELGDADSELLDAAVIEVRPAGLGDFAISIDARGSDATSVDLRIDNVAPDTLVSAGEFGTINELPGVVQPTLTRKVLLDLRAQDGPLSWVRGVRTCPDAYRIVAAGDVQTNPLQFERIVQQLHVELADAEDAGEPLLGMLLLGDLSESSTEDEFRRIREILASSPVPVATIPGNHDILGDELAIYNRMFGPGNYAFEVCDTHVVMLDSANGDLAPSVEASLSRLARPGEANFLIAGTHYPAHAGRTGAGFANEEQAFYLMSELARNGAELLLTGHVHTWRAYDDLSYGGSTIDQIITGTAGASQGAGQPHFGYTRLTFTERLQTCFVEVPEPGRTPGDGGAGDGALRRCEAP